MEDLYRSIYGNEVGAGIALVRGNRRLGPGKGSSQRDKHSNRAQKGIVGWGKRPQRVFGTSARVFPSFAGGHQSYSFFSGVSEGREACHWRNSPRHRSTNFSKAGKLLNR